MSKQELSVYPNPFNEKTTVSFNLKKDGEVHFRIYDMVGKCIKTIDPGVKHAGLNEIVLNSGDMKAGIYFLRMEDWTGVRTIKIAINR
jgi:hypothetical protein